MSIDTIELAWILLGLFLIIGLLVYERTGLRLGGVLVLPLLLVYALFDLTILLVFSMATIAALIVGHLVYTQTFLYGRRLLYVFLIIGIAFSLVAREFVVTAATGFVVALLPGLFAYNLHREGRYVEGTSAFMMWFGLLLAGGVLLTWAITQPDRIQDAGVRVAQATGSDAPASIAAAWHNAVAAMETRLGMLGASITSVPAADAVLAVDAPEPPALAGVAGLTMAQAAHDMGAAE